MMAGWLCRRMEPPSRWMSWAGVAESVVDPPHLLPINHLLFLILYLMFFLKHTVVQLNFVRYNLRIRLRYWPFSH